MFTIFGSSATLPKFRPLPGVTDKGTSLHEQKNPAVYILASRRNGTLYIGVTSDLCNRIAQHRDGTISGFTKTYDVKILVWFQDFNSMEEAIKREKQLKEWKRIWKIELIEKSNPDWHDLFPEECETTIPEELHNVPGSRLSPG
ncbi:MAG: GIY-YIG nuclease family protein [Aestuariivirga sp.]